MLNYNHLENLNFLGNVAMTLNPVLKELLMQKAYRIKKNKGENVNFKVVLPSETNYINRKVIDADKVEYLPDIITDIGFEHIFNSKFVKKFIKKGEFKSKNNNYVSKEFAEAGCIDPEGIYEIFAATPYVFLIDKNKIGNKPIPRKMEDILKECYRNQIIVNGEKGKISFVLLLYIFKEFGMEGIARLKLNVKDTWHGSKMAWVAGANNEDGVGIYIIPWIFAKACPRVKSTMIVWPDDGAIISPMILVSKKSLDVVSKEIYHIITGKDFGNITANSYYLSASPFVNNNIPKNSKIKWLGWNFIRQNDIPLLKKILR